MSSGGGLGFSSAITRAPEKDYTSPPQNVNGDGGGGGGGGGGWGYGYGGSSSGPTDEQRRAAGNLGGIVGYNADTLRNKYDQSMQTFDLADKQNAALRNNNRLLAKQSAGDEWFRQHKKLQATASALNDRSGNAMRGSFLYDYRDLLGAADDMIDAETLDTLRQNENAVLQSYFESMAQNNVSRQEAAIDTESSLRELYADYVAQLNNIHPDLAQDQIDAEGHTLNGVDWLDTEWFEKHKREPLRPDRHGFYRPDSANTVSVDKGIRTASHSTASSAVRSYWDRMNRGYDQRTRQA